MNAEVRYSFYLRLLRDWVVKHNSGAEKEDWPLPPWDVALMFYIHMLAPQRFKKDITVEYPELWNTGMAFPLARLRQHSHNDEASQQIWEAAYPDIPYQICTIGPDETPHISTTTPHALDVHGYQCGSSHCTAKKRQGRTQIIPMAEWFAYRLGKRRSPSCPSCKTAFSPNQAGYNSTFALFCQTVFGQHVFGLWDAPLRQMAFVERILAELSTTPHSESILKQAQARYLQFLRLIHAHPSTTLVPTIDIDLVWHTHQLSPKFYDIYCLLHINRTVKHDDTIPSTGRATALDDTKRLWALEYAELFLDGRDGDHAEIVALLKEKGALYKTLHSSAAQGLSKFDSDHDIPGLRRALAETDSGVRAGIELRMLQYELDTLARQLRERKHELAVTKMPWTGVGRWRWFSPRRRRELVRMEEAVAAAEERWREKGEEVKAQQAVVDKIGAGRKAAEERFREVQAEREGVKTRLLAQAVMVEKEVVESVAKADQLRGEPLGKGMLSVVPSEAQIMAPPVVGEWPRERSGSVKCWGTKIGNPPHWKPHGHSGGSFGGMAFGPDYRGPYAACGGAGWGEFVNLYPGYSSSRGGGSSSSGGGGCAGGGGGYGCGGGGGGGGCGGGGGGC
jgi:hypothetical protein